MVTDVVRHLNSCWGRVLSRLLLGCLALLGLVDLSRTAMAQMTTEVYLPVMRAETPEEAELADRVKALEQLLARVHRDGPDLYFEGVNVHVISGAGTTDAPPNGLGNLVIGYNEPIGGVDFQGNPNDVRSGSHMLVLGKGNSYSSYGGIAGGIYTKATAPWASVIGGRENVASADLAVVLGGQQNRASALAAVCLGGWTNQASGVGSTVAGGDGNEAAGWLSSVTGGTENTARGDRSSITSGRDNDISPDAEFGAVSGGAGNQVDAQGGSVSGGTDNVVRDGFGWAGGRLHSP